MNKKASKIVKTKTIQAVDEVRGEEIQVRIEIPLRPNAHRKDVRLRHGAECCSVYGMPSGVLRDGKLPVFVFPLTVNFYLNDQTTHKQVLTLYNPYDFPIRFKVLCTSPSKYTVVDPDGSIKARCCIDIVIRHTAISLANCNVTDKFRIQMQDHITKQVIGRRDVNATLMSGVPDRSTPDRENFETLPPVQGPRQSQLQYSLMRRDSAAPGRGNSPNFIVWFTGVICFIALLLPNEGEQSTIPVQLSFNLKLMLAYILGLVTMAIFKP